MNATKLKVADAEVLGAIERLVARIPAGFTVVTVRRAKDEDETPVLRAAIAQTGATDDAVCHFCRERCWWSAAAKWAPGKKAPVCTACIGEELQKLRAEGDAVEATLITSNKLDS